MEKLYIHFDINTNYINAEQFTQTLESIDNTYLDLNNNLFKIKNDYELIVLPPESGSFITLLAIILAPSTIYTGIKILETEIGKKLIKGLTGSEPSIHAENIGQTINNCIKGFYSKNNNELKKIIPKTINLDRALKAKSDFYQTCINNKDIKAIGFDKSEKFIVNRNEFILHLTDDIIRELPSNYRTQKLLIVKSVNVDKKGKWSFRDIDTNEYFNANILDTHFRKGFYRGKYPLKNSKKEDQIIAEVEYQKELKNGKENSKDININKIYSFNDIEIRKLPSKLVFIPDENSKKEEDNQLNLFDRNDLD